MERSKRVNFAGFRAYDRETNRGFGGNEFFLCKLQGWIKLKDVTTKILQTTLEAALNKVTEPNFCCSSKD